MATKPLPFCAMILAGGLGTRLRPVVADRPKPMAPVDGVTFIEVLLDSLADKGATDFVLLTGYMGDMIEELLGTHKRGGMKIRFSMEQAPLGTGGAVKNAEAFATDPTLLVNGDTFFDADLNSLFEYHLAKAVEVTLSLVRVRDRGPYGAVELDSNGMVTGFREKGRDGAGPGWINAGLTLMSLDVIRGLPEGRSFSMEQEVFPELARSGRMAGLGQDRPFFDIGTPESFREFHRFVQHLKGGKDGGEEDTHAGW